MKRSPSSVVCGTAAIVSIRNVEAPLSRLRMPRPRVAVERCSPTYLFWRWEQIEGDTLLHVSVTRNPATTGHHHPARGLAKTNAGFGATCRNLFADYRRVLAALTAHTAGMLSEFSPSLRLHQLAAWVSESTVALEEQRRPDYDRWHGRQAGGIRNAGETAERSLRYR